MEPMEPQESSFGSALTSLVRRLSGYAAKGIRYWEPRRVLYNLVLALVVLGHFAARWPASRSVLSLDLVLAVFLLAVLANVAYCAAYVVDVFLQFSELETALTRGRLAVLVVGTAFAGVITHFFALAILG